ncbi:hypothetical protein [Dyella subtropica]|uniref:hypothetical protein n=1 Tax=Dyella subtropica TaxID=2992127 RepID=UPI00225329C3|nr:hypothetical protein [Dyella subtropica]
MRAQPPLLTRLRRRLHGARWLFALLVVLKFAAGAACLAVDGGRVEATSAVTTGAVTTVIVEATQASIQDDAATSCWHDGANGCHCHCTHATPLASRGLAYLLHLQPVRVFVAMRPAVQSPPMRNLLRPPIA